MALGRANAFSRFVMCGGISQYNAENKSGPMVSKQDPGKSCWDTVH